MKTLLAATAIGTLLAGGALAQTPEVKIGIALGFNGPLESLAPPMAGGAQLAIAEVNDSGLLLGGATVTPVSGDTTCEDASAGTATGERLVGEGVKGIMGAMCSGPTGAILSNVAVPNGIVMISPSATSPALSTVEDNGLFFRTAPSDARQGDVMAEIIMDRGINEVALTYTNNDYGKGLADSFQSAFEAAGGTVTITESHKDGQGDYFAEVGALASAGGEALVVVGYVDQGGSGIIRGVLDSGAFDIFVLPDGMVGAFLEENFGNEIDGSFGQLPGSDSEGAAIFAEMVGDAFDPTSAYAGESYDAAALMLLAMQAAGSTEASDYKDMILTVANAPGEPILPGELAKGLQILADGGEIDYVGASGVELLDAGESAGNYREIEIKDGKIETVGFR
ncbi:MAG: ABC transporter substrate-binding protein [Rhodobacteraceae bacterium]|nr:ABC transporter substrate-binding protein [Paracoccaceae bacterium]